MKLPQSLDKYTKDNLRAIDAQRQAEFIAWGPAVFQVSRLMIKFGVFALLDKAQGGLTREEIVKATGLSDYAVKCMLEASLCIGTVIIEPDKETYSLSKTGWFLLNDDATRANIDFNHDVNYQGWFRLEESLKEGRPVLHGYAVAWGLIGELYLSVVKCGFPKDILRQAVQFIRQHYGEPRLDCKQYERLVAFMKHDKKNEGDSINFTLLGNIGDIRINQQATKDEILEMLDFLREG